MTPSGHKQPPTSVCLRQLRRCGGVNVGEQYRPLKISQADRCASARCWRARPDLASDHVALTVEPHRCRERRIAPFTRSRLRRGAGAVLASALKRHVSLETTNRYPEITVRMKQDALNLCEPVTTKPPKRKPVWHDDAELMKWLTSL